MSSLKDALLKAGLKSSKTENMRENLGPKKQRKKSELHQQERNFCEVCQLIQPDVERFKHKNPTVDAEWICAACADKEEILDQFRITQQSEFSKAKRYRREFGATKDFSKEQSGPNNRRPHSKNKNSHNPGNQKNNRNNRNKNFSKNREEKNFNR